MKSATGATLIMNCQVIDGTGAPPIPNGIVVIKDGKISHVGRSAMQPQCRVMR